LSDVLGYGITGAARAALDPTAPGYYGRGAVNNRFAQDEAERQKRIVTDKAQAAMESEFNQAEKGYRNELQAYQDTQQQPNQAPVAQPATTPPASAPAVNGAGQIQPPQASAQEELNRFNQPLVAQPAAPVPAITTAGLKQPAQKIVTRARILALSRKHKVPFPDAVKQFQDKGYVIK
jgi:hypothetical protein